MNNVNAIKRNNVFDIAKAIGIILVLLGHSNSPFKDFYVMFHVPIFFIIAGYFIKEKSWENLSEFWNFVKKKVRSLWLPYVFFNIIFLLLNNFFIEHNLYTTSEIFLEGDIGNNFGLAREYSILKIFEKMICVLLFSAGTQLGGATWFLRALFWVSIFYCIMNASCLKVFKNNKYIELIKFIICLIVLYLGYLFYLIDFNYDNIGVMFSMFIFAHIGFYYRKIEKNLNNLPYIIPVGLIISFLILCLILAVSPDVFCISANRYYNPIFLLGASVSGFFIVMAFSKLINRNNVFTRIFSYIGRNTIPILCLHLLFFKLITVLQIHLYNLPAYRLASFPCYITTGGWWVSYFLVGLIGPLLVNEIYQWIKTIVLNRLKKRREQ